MEIRFTLPRVTVGGSTDCALVLDGEDPLGAVVEQTVQTISTDVMLKIGGVTMFLAAWQDPEHWAEDWAEHAGDQDAREFVEGLLAEAVESR